MDPTTIGSLGPRRDRRKTSALGTPGQRLVPAGERPLQKPADVAGRDDSGQPAVINYQGSTPTAALGDAEQVRDRVSRACRRRAVEWTADLFDKGRLTSLRRYLLESGEGQDSAQPAVRIVSWKGRMPRGQDVAMQCIFNTDVVGSLYGIGRHHV